MPTQADFLPQGRTSAPQCCSCERECAVSTRVCVPRVGRAGPVGMRACAQIYTGACGVEGVQDVCSECVHKPAVGAPLTLQAGSSPHCLRDNPGSSWFSLCPPSPVGSDRAGLVVRAIARQGQRHSVSCGALGGRVSGKGRVGGPVIQPPGGAWLRSGGPDLHRDGYLEPTPRTHHTKHAETLSPHPPSSSRPWGLRGSLAQAWPLPIGLSSTPRCLGPSLTTHETCTLVQPWRPICEVGTCPLRREGPPPPGQTVQELVGRGQPAAGSSRASPGTEPGGCVQVRTEQLGDPSAPRGSGPHGRWDAHPAPCALHGHCRPEQALEPWEEPRRPA